MLRHHNLFRQTKRGQNVLRAVLLVCLLMITHFIYHYIMGSTSLASSGLQYLLPHSRHPPPAPLRPPQQQPWWHHLSLNEISPARKWIMEKSKGEGAGLIDSSDWKQIPAGRGSWWRKHLRYYVDVDGMHGRKRSYRQTAMGRLTSVCTMTHSFETKIVLFVFGAMVNGALRILIFEFWYLPTYNCSKNY